MIKSTIMRFQQMIYRQTSLSSGGCLFSSNYIAPRCCTITVGAYIILILLSTQLTTIAMTRYVVNGNAYAQEPYTNWTTAASDIQAAIDSAEPGDEIVVSDGVYNTGGTTNYPTGSILTNRVSINKPVSVRSVNGPAVTEIRGAYDPIITNGNASVRCVWMTNGASLHGFTVTGGSTRYSWYGITETCEGGGGGIACQSRQSVVSNCIIFSNCAAFVGGGGIIGGTVYDSVLQYNQAWDSGGGAWSANLYGCRLNNNFVRREGGGATWSYLSSCTISNNTARSGGGACWSTVANCTVNNNLAVNGFGGGVGGCSVYNTTLRDNYVSFSGWNEGSGGGAAWCSLWNCLLVGNIAEQGGGGAAESFLTNCVLQKNIAFQYGGGTWGGSLDNSTVVSCISSNSGGGVNSSDLHNCIVYYNQAPNGANYSDATIEYSCSDPSPIGMGNISGDPQFVDYANNNLRLDSNSPCINAGDNSVVTYHSDMDGNPRFINEIVDMGAYEYQFDAGYWVWASVITNGLTNYTDCATSDGFPNLLKYATGSNPTNPDDLAQISCTITNGLPALIFSRNTNAVEVTVTVQGAFTISNGTLWAGLATNRYGSWCGASNVVEIGISNPVSCILQDTAPSPSKRFLRMIVTRP